MDMSQPNQDKTLFQRLASLFERDAKNTQEAQAQAKIKEDERRQRVLLSKAVRVSPDGQYTVDIKALSQTAKFQEKINLLIELEKINVRNKKLLIK